MAPREPGRQETGFIFVSRQPGSAGPFARVGPGPAPDAGNQTCQSCMPRARLGHMQLTKRALQWLTHRKVKSPHAVVLLFLQDIEVEGED
jgi:hypothetical protein